MGVIDTKGVVQYEWFWRNHHVRLSAETLLATVKDLQDPKNKVFTNLTEALENPQAVKRMNLGYQGLTELSPEVAELKKFVDEKAWAIYDFRHNQITHLPDAICKLKKLDLTGNPVPPDERLRLQRLWEREKKSPSALKF